MDYTFCTNAVCGLEFAFVGSEKAELANKNAAIVAAKAKDFFDDFVMFCCELGS